MSLAKPNTPNIKIYYKPQTHNQAKNMKKTLQFILSVMMLFMVTSCEKNDYDFKQTASIIVINTAVGNGSIRVNAGAGSSFAYSKATDIAYSASALYGAYTGTNTINVVSSTDSTKSFFNRTVDLQTVSTLYITGQSPTIDTLFRTERNLPYLSGSVTNPDNSLYLRFVNLSPNSPALNINIKTAITNEVTGLAYKGISSFKKYEALTTTANYVYEVRDATTNAILTTFTLTTSSNRYKTISLIIKGLVGTTTGTNAFGILQVNYTG